MSGDRVRLAPTDDPPQSKALGSPIWFTQQPEIHYGQLLDKFNVSKQAWTKDGQPCLTFVVEARWAFKLARFTVQFLDEDGVPLANSGGT